MTNQILSCPRGHGRLWVRVTVDDKYELITESYCIICGYQPIVQVKDVQLPTGKPHCKSFTTEEAIP